MSFELIVFDWDGTLMDSQARIVHCMRKAFENLDLPPPSHAAVSAVIGLSLDKAIEQLHPHAEAPTLDALIHHYRAHFFDERTQPSMLFEGVRETLDWLRANDYLLAVATGKSRRGLDRELEETGLTEVFHTTRCSDETVSKPDPRMLLEIIATLGATPETTLMIGDSEYDLLMAAQARTAAVAVTYGTQPLEELELFAPLTYLDRLDALPEWLRQHQSSRTRTNDGGHDS